MTSSPQLAEPSVRAVLDCASSLAGRIVADGLAIAQREQSRRPEATRKAAHGDLLTSADLLVERAIAGWIRDEFHSHGVLGEEGTVVPAAGEWVWRVDPIDGTNNYAYGSPVFGTAVSLHHHDEVVVAAIAHHETVVIAQQSRSLRIVEAGAPRVPNEGERGVLPSFALWLGYGVDRLRSPLKEILAVLNGTARRTFESWAPTVDTVVYLRGGIDVVVGYRCRGEELRASLFILASAGASMKTLDGDDFHPSNPPELFLAGRPEHVARVRSALASGLASGRRKGG